MVFGKKKKRVAERDSQWSTGMTLRVNTAEPVHSSRRNLSLVLQQEKKVTKNSNPTYISLSSWFIVLIRFCCVNSDGTCRIFFSSGLQGKRYNHMFFVRVILPLHLGNNQFHGEGREAVEEVRCLRHSSKRLPASPCCSLASGCNLAVGEALSQV